MKKILILLMLSLVNTLHGTTWIVDTTGTEIDTIYAKISLAQSTPGIDTILFLQGRTYLVGDSILGIKPCDSLVLLGEAGTSLPVLSAAGEITGNTGSEIIFSTAIHALTIKRLIISGGVIPIKDGGGMDITIDSCTIRDGTSRGIEASSYNFHITHSKITGNTGSLGAGLYYTGNMLIIDTSIISNNSGSYGAGILLIGTDSCIIRGSILESNSASSGGGGIQTDENTHLSLIEDTFRHNTAHWGGAVYAKNGSQINIYACVFDSNSVINFGGALFIKDTSSLTSTQNIYLGNRSAQTGGAAQIRNATATFHMDTFTLNVSDTGPAAIFSQINSIVSVNNCVFEQDSGKKGGIIGAHDTAQVYMDSCNFNYCYALGLDGLGGALHLSYAEIKNSQINHCMTFPGTFSYGFSNIHFLYNTVEGGFFSIYIDSISNGFIYGNIFENDSAQIALIRLRYSSIGTIEQNVFRNNFLYDGGLIAIEDSSYPYIQYNLFENNTGLMSISDPTYIIKVDMGSMDCKYNTFISNHPVYNNIDNGIIIITNPIEVYVENNTISNCTTFRYAPIDVTYNFDTLNTCEITENTITQNLAVAARAGGISIFHANATLRNNVVMLNKVDYSYPYIASGVSLIGYTNSPYTVDLSNNVIAVNSNTVVSMGGLLVLYCNANLYNDAIYSNTGTGYGGGLTAVDASVHLKKCIIASNKGTNGGGVSLRGGAEIILDSCSIIDNGSLGDIYSGGIYVTTDTLQRDSILLMHSSNFYFNTFQDDIEIYNLNSQSIDLSGNWWNTQSISEINGLIMGAADFSGYLSAPVYSAPYEPVRVDSILNFDSYEFLHPTDSLNYFDTLYIEVYGEDRNPGIRDYCMLKLISSVYPTGIAVATIETDTNSGVFEGIAYVMPDTDSASIRTDDVLDIIRIDTTADSIRIESMEDPTVFHTIYFNISGVNEAYKPHKEKFYFTGPTIVNSLSDIRIIYNTPIAANVKIVLYDPAGREVKVIKDGKINKGTYKFSINKVGKLHQGIYFIRATVSGKNYTKRFIYYRD